MHLAHPLTVYPGIHPIPATSMSLYLYPSQPYPRNLNMRCIDINRLTQCHDQEHMNNSHFNTLRPRQDGRHFADDIFTFIFFNENCCILNKFSLKYVRKGPIDNNPALVLIMAWRRSGDKPLSEPMMMSLPTRICVTRPQ